MNTHPSLLVATAVGGPRDGVRLSCPALWNGVILKGTTYKGTRTYYPGHYVWGIRNGNNAWVWIDDLH
jgi:hypothetical protein